MNGFGVPAAAVKVQVDSFLFANECFLQITGLTVADLPTTSLLKLVSFPSNYRPDAKPVPVTIRSLDQSLTIRGHIACGNQGLAYVVIPSQFHQARDLRGEQEQQRPATYLSSRLASKLIALDFSIEFIRAHSVTKNHSAELEVKEILEDM
jgi:hypothetical protein